MVAQPSTLNPAAKAAACPVNPDLKEPLENQEDPANPELPANQETPENHQLLHAKQPLLHHASHAHKAHPDLLDHPDHLETQERLVPPADPDTMPPLEPQAHEDHPDQPEKPAQLDHPERLVSQLLPNHSPLESPEKPEILDHPDLPAHPDNPVWMAQPAHPDQRENLVPQEILEPMVNQDPPDHLAQPVPPEKRVSARNTALSMVVSSSKMELVVKFVNRVYASFTRSASKHLSTNKRCSFTADHNIVFLQEHRVDDVPNVVFVLFSCLFLYSIFSRLQHLPMVTIFCVFSTQNKDFHKAIYLLLVLVRSAPSWHCNSMPSLFKRNIVLLYL